MFKDSDRVLLSKSSTYLFSTTFFKDPEDPDNLKMWKPFEPQVLLYNLLDFGYDIAHTHQKPTKLAEIVVMLWPRQYGKTTACATAAAALSLRYPNSHIGIVSATEDSAKDFIERIVWFINNSPFKDSIVKQRVDRIDLKNGSKISSFPNSEKAIKGKSFTWLFVDESALIDDEIIDGACLPTVRTAGAFRKWHTPSIVLLSTPKGPKGRFYDYFVSGLEKREICCKSCGRRENISHYQRISFDSRIMPPLPACENCGKDEFEYVPNEIITVTLDPWNHPTRTKQEIEAELAVRGNTPLARQELLGQIISESAGVFAKEWLDNCTNPKLLNHMAPTADRRYAMAVDFGKSHDATVFTLGYMKDNRITAEYIKRLPSQGGLEYAEIRRDLLSLINQYCPYILIMDATGIGNPIVEQIEYDIRDLQTIGIVGRYKHNGGIINYEIAPNKNVYTKIFDNKTNQRGFIFDYQSKVDLITNLSNLFQRQLIEIPGQYTNKDIEILFKELINFAFEYSNNNRIIYGTQREHDDTVISLALMAWGCKQTPWYNCSAKLGVEDQFVLK
jgi:hypothetical protein